MKILFPITVFAVCFTNVTNAQDFSCNISAYSIDRDRNGLNVRAAPRIGGKIIARLKRVKDGPDNEIMPEFDVIASKGNWLKIANAREGLDGKRLTKRSGWVHNSRVAMMTRGYSTGGVSAKQKAAIASPTIGRIPAETEVGVRGCHGGWALIQHKRTKGWLAPLAQCGTASTTCN